MFIILSFAGEYHQDPEWRYLGSKPVEEFDRKALPPGRHTVIEVDDPAAGDGVRVVGFFDQPAAEPAQRPPARKVGRHKGI
jgi:hypothetical protein